MKIQISFDMPDLDVALKIAEQVADYADILEVGTLLIYQNGISALERFQTQFSDKTILADTKIVDRGKDATTLIAQADIQWITVMAGTGKQVIHSVCTTAHQYNMKVMLDLIDTSSVGESAMEAKKLGVDALLFHQAYDEKDALILLDKWEMVRGNTNLPVFISAKITRGTINSILDIGPNGIVLGKTITDAENPREEARYFYKIIKGETSK